MMENLPIACRISQGSGWLDIATGVYRLSSTAFENEQVTWRRTDVNNPFVEGSWTVNALRENVTSQLDVWIRGETAVETKDAVAALRDCLAQRNYVIEATFDGIKRTYLCYVADVMIKTSRELRFSTMAQVSAAVPRHPTFAEVEV